MTATTKVGTRSTRPRKAIGALLVVFAIAAGIATYLRADDPAPSAAEVSQTQRYCDLSARLDGLLAQAGIASVGVAPAIIRPESATQVLEQFGNQAEELERLAPAGIRIDVQRVLEALRAAAGGRPETVENIAFSDAGARLAAYRQTQDACLTGAGSGDQ